MTLVYTNFILSKMSLQERLFFDLIFEKWIWFYQLYSCISFSTFKLFPNCFCSHIFCKCFEFFTSNNNFSNLWSSNFEKICSNFYRSWNCLFLNKGDCSSAKSLCESSKTSSMLSCMSWNTRELR